MSGLTIGFFASTYWGSSIDDLRIYDRVLSSIEITAPYNFVDSEGHRISVPERVHLITHRHRTPPGAVSTVVGRESTTGARAFPLNPLSGCVRHAAFRTRQAAQSYSRNHRIRFQFDVAFSASLFRRFNMVDLNPRSDPRLTAYSEIQVAGTAALSRVGVYAPYANDVEAAVDLSRYRIEAITLRLEQCCTEGLHRRAFDSPRGRVNAFHRREVGALDPAWFSTLLRLVDFEMIEVQICQRQVIPSRRCASHLRRFCRWHRIPVGEWKEGRVVVYGSAFGTSPPFYPVRFSNRVEVPGPVSVAPDWPTATSACACNLHLPLSFPSLPSTPINAFPHSGR